MGIWWAGSILVTELSVFPMNAVHILRYLKKTDTRAYLVSGLSLVAFFFIARIVTAPFIVWRFVHNGFCYSEFGPFFSAAVTGGLCLIYVLNCFWFTKLVKGALKTLAKSSDIGPTKSEKAAVEKNEPGRVVNPAE